MSLLYSNDRPGVYPDSYYAASVPPRAVLPALDGDRRCDVCVIGAGYTGLSAALHLAQAGADVTLIDAHRVGWGASGRNGGQMSGGQRVDAPDMAKMFGLDRARALWSLGEDAKALVKSLIAEHKMACDLKPGVAHMSQKPDGLEAYVETMARDFGATGLSYIPRDAVASHVQTDAYAEGVLDQDAAHLHPLKYAIGLAEACAAAGVRIYENTRATALYRGDPAGVETTSGRITADHVILAANGYHCDLVPEVAGRAMPINNFILATEPLPNAGRDLIPSDIAVADAKFVVNYYRLSADGRLLFGGGESYGYRFPKDIKAFVRRPMLETFPQLAGARIDYGWGGTLAITVRRLPHLMRVTPNILSAAGYSGHGVALATLSGKLMADALLGQADGFETMAAIPQFPFPGGRVLRTPLLALAMSYYALRDRLR
ncbi:gamma-glutamylputrescine oxidase [Rubricella aquisinus]|uniref:Gamma-glutamylputrescine oxidase n=1 Tax=Rubricella aquisinus TaxID=2028108 RepID=A0A840WIS9_9RHOB|nr:FAD-binding oxidoreductase [Rubricella aquisinus]MBB5514123.1 gamma-glutamylputrescine oxidase [Rubricella aquisinus]